MSGYANGQNAAMGGQGKGPSSRPYQSPPWQGGSGGGTAFTPMPYSTQQGFEGSMNGGKSMPDRPYQSPPWQGGPGGGRGFEGSMDGGKPMRDNPYRPYQSPPIIGDGQGGMAFTPMGAPDPWLYGDGSVGPGGGNRGLGRYGGVGMGPGRGSARIRGSGQDGSFAPWEWGGGQGPGKRMPDRPYQSPPWQGRIAY